MSMWRSYVYNDFSTIDVVIDVVMQGTSVLRYCHATKTKQTEISQQFK